MRVALAVLFVVHGALHLLGVAKAWRPTAVPQLTQHISPLVAGGWALASTLFLIAAAAVLLRRPWWWAIVLAASFSSQAVIATSWSDARFGSIINLLTLAAAAFGALIDGPLSLRAVYVDEIRREPAGVADTRVVADVDVAHLPPPVQRYLRLVGAVGRPRVDNVRARMHGRIRRGPTAEWMSFSAEQFNFFGAQRRRLFYMRASQRGLPLQGLHRYVGGEASMRIKVAGLIPVVDVAGEDLTRAETVTMLNDMCLLAPATLLDPTIGWEVLDDRSVRATFVNAGHAVRADLFFDESGTLIDFRSNDRSQSGDDGRQRPVPWSTPVHGSRRFGDHRLWERGEGRWHERTGDYAYIEVVLDDVVYNVPHDQRH